MSSEEEKIARQAKIARDYDDRLEARDRDDFGDRKARLERAKREQRIQKLNRKAGWTNKPATKPQMILLGRLYGKGKQWPNDLMQGQASFFIDKRLGAK